MRRRGESAHRLHAPKPPARDARRDASPLRPARHRGFERDRARNGVARARPLRPQEDEPLRRASGAVRAFGRLRHGNARQDRARRAGLSDGRLRQALPLVLRGLAHARRALPRPRLEARLAPLGRAVELPRPPRRRVAAEVPEGLRRNAHAHFARPLPPADAHRHHRRGRRGDGDALRGQPRLVSARARGALRAPEGGEGESRSPPRAVAAFRRPLPRPGVQGRAGAEPPETHRQDRREAHHPAEAGDERGARPPRRAAAKRHRDVPRRETRIFV